MKILLAVDDQVQGEIILKFALEHARLPEADVRIVSAIPSILDYKSQAVFPDLVDELRLESKKTADILVHTIAERLKNDCPTAHVAEQVLEGHPADTILLMAKEWNADLIVVGSHGRHGLSKFILGSVSSEIVAHAPCSVLVVKMTASEKLSEKAETGALCA